MQIRLTGVVLAAVTTADTTTSVRAAVAAVDREASTAARVSLGEHVGFIQRHLVKLLSFICRWCCEGCADGEGDEGGDDGCELHIGNTGVSG